MKKPMLFMLAAVFSAGIANATEHHSGHGGGPIGGGGSSAGCVKPRLTNYKPAHLETVVPGAEFSFFALNVHKPGQISVTVKNIPVEVTAEFREPYYLVKGKLPDTLVNTAARINIKVSSKSPQCEAESGWLLKIADK
ncbi:MAG: hypothetical protein EPN89_05990 [Methylovulum sp.]|nr:MAG: hypothetical protein EPN89_05990 [Methylovulum sp.]